MEKSSAWCSDETWKLTTDGPIRANNEYDGEDYDARKELAGWSRPGFDDSQWQPAQVVDGPAGVLAAQRLRPSASRKRSNRLRFTSRGPAFISSIWARTWSAGAA